MLSILTAHGHSLKRMASSLAHYGIVDWTSSDLAYLIASANLNLVPRQSDLDWLKAKTNLLPPKLLTPLDEGRLRETSPDADRWEERELPPEMATVLDGRFTDDDFLKVFPARTKLDLGIRRARAGTVYRLYKNTKSTDTWRTWIPRLVHLDYISVCNLLVAHQVHGPGWLEFWWTTGALNSLESWDRISKHVNNSLKKLPASDYLRQRYAEAGGMSGYRNPPFPGFDPIQDTKELAEAGIPHGFPDSDWIAELRASAVAVQGSSVPDSVPYLTLEAYIASDLATTQGASTTGVVTWEFETDSGKFKARKNFLLDLFSPAYLAQQTMLHLGKQVNRSFIKAELGKMRVAVTGDIWSYFSQSWLNYLCGHVYLQWEANTMEEDLASQTERMASMMRLLHKAYGLPFDFAGFDHQPSTSELQLLTQLYLERGSVNVPDDQLEVWRKVLRGTVESFDSSTIQVHEGAKLHSWRVLGGLPSGIRLTSLLGNYWNTACTRWCRRFLKECGLTDPLLSWIRGDDSAIFAKTYWSALLMRLAYGSVNAVGNDDKYGIHWQQTEFLRVWYRDTHALGYPNRAIPALMQRKPWSSDPWSPEGVVSAQLEALATLERRLARPLDHIRHAIKQDWSRIRHTTTRWLDTPAPLGGLGLDEYKGWVPSLAWPTLAHPRIKFTNRLAGSELLLEDAFSPWNPSVEQLVGIQLNRMSDKAVTDDVRGVAAVFRDQYSRELARRPRVTWRQYHTLPFPTQNMSPLAALLRSVASLDTLLRIRGTVGADFGSASNLKARWTLSQEYARVSKLRPFAALLDYAPSAARVVLRLERRGLHRTASLDYVFGEITGLYTGSLHPMLLSVVQSALSVAVDPWIRARGHWTRETWGWFVSVVAGWFSQELKASPFVQKFYSW